MVNYIKVQSGLPLKTKEQVEILRQKRDLVVRYILLFAFIIVISVTLIPLCLQMLNPYADEDSPKLQLQEQKRLVCYYSSDLGNLNLLDIPGNLCTHINIGLAGLHNSTLQLSPSLERVLQNETNAYRIAHPQVHLLLWIGGADTGHQFSEMVVNHARRKQFLRSLRDVLHKYPSLDGIDLDWEFPRAYDNERMHLSQLLHEVRLEWAREKFTNHILSLAVAAPEGIAFFAYNIREINLYVDFVNLMSYDFHFYTENTPFTGLNAPLYARPGERSIMATFNINYTASWWLQNGLEPQRLVIGLPTFGHSFTLVSSWNARLGAPASGIGKCGQLGFTTSSETCKCASNFHQPIYSFDNATCSPYLSFDKEWISYESDASIACKAKYVRSLNVGGAMIFSLNADDLTNSCGWGKEQSKKVFPLTQIVKSILGT